MKEAVIVSTARTPIGRAFKGALNNIKSPTMTAHVITHAVERAGVDGGEIEDVIIGSVLNAGTASSNIARTSVFAANLPVTVSAQTIDRQCSSGVMAIATAAKQIMVDGMSICVAGGQDNISAVQMPYYEMSVKTTDPNVQKDVYICFIDYTKAFDRVKHFKMIECLSEIGIDDKDLQIISKLYWEQSACVRTESGMTSDFKIKKGVRQGCVLSPNLFNLYTEKIFREVEDMKGINIGGVNINNLRYADDTVLLAEDPMFLQALLTAVNEKGKPYGMEMNIIKTKSMVISRKKSAPKISISVEGKPIQQVDRMVYLGYMATEDGKCDKEIKRRIGIARTAFESMAKILTSRNISIELRSRIAKCYIWSTLLYGAETWTLTKVTSDKLEAFEMWLYRRMLRISWKEHKTHADVLHKMKTKRSLLNTIKKRKCQYFGHIIRGDGIQRLLMEGRINGRRGRGRPRTMWTDNIKEWTKMSYNDCIRVAQDRERWRSMTADLLTTDGT